MITAHLMGGLGNQLFQIFTTIAYSLNNKKPFIFEYNKRRGEPKYRQTIYWENFLKNLKRFTTQENINYHVYKEKNFTYNDIPTTLYKFTDAIKDFKLFGYFQSEKYFKSQYENIIKFIGLRKQQELINIPENCISLHFRIGDYVLPQFKDTHPLMPIEYYVNALNKILLLSGDFVPQTPSCKNDGGVRPTRNVLYFCQKEDNNIVDTQITYLKEKFPKLTFIKASDESEDWEQMLMMSCCEHQIIANSSFSWWGAYFNASNDKIVCYPDVWFGSKSSNNTKDLCPNEWIKIPISSN